MSYTVRPSTSSRLRWLDVWICSVRATELRDLPPLESIVAAKGLFAVYSPIAKDAPPQRSKKSRSIANAVANRSKENS